MMWFVVTKMSPNMAGSSVVVEEEVVTAHGWWHGWSMGCRGGEKAGVLPDRGLGMFEPGVHLFPPKFVFHPPSSFFLHCLVLPDITGQPLCFPQYSTIFTNAPQHPLNARHVLVLKQPRLSLLGSVWICGPHADRTHHCSPILQLYKSSQLASGTPVPRSGPPD